LSWTSMPVRSGIKRSQSTRSNSPPQRRATALRRVLAEHEVELVHSGQAAVARLCGGEFDLVLCDLLMPDLTGMDVHDKVMAAAPDVAERMVFMTGGAFTARAREFLERVPNARFDKPIDHRWLRTFVAERVQQRSATAAAA